MEGQTFCNISAAVFRGMFQPVFEELKNLGVTSAHLAAGRSISLQDRKGFLGIRAGSALVEEPVDCFSFMVRPELESTVLDSIIKTANLDVPGQGSIYSEDITLLKAHELCLENSGSIIDSVENRSFLSKLTGICCIVQRGLGDVVGRVALDTGTCVPVVTFGSGTGVRDKLGLLRITIPAEKEIVTLAAGVDDAATVMDMMIDAGRLDEPGKGFIFLFPIKKGIMNTRIWRGRQQHAASIEQIIAALDEVRGDTRWRSRFGTLAGDKYRYMYLMNLVDLTLICNEGRGEELAAAAMSAGAAGATISRLKYICPQDSRQSEISPAREISRMIVAQDRIPAILDALENAAAFDDANHGLLYSRPAPKACTYL
jgi:nitrogen regulatory protein PII